MSVTSAQFIFLTFITNYLYQCPLYPKTNYQTACDLNHQNHLYDFIVIGGGSAGSAIANRLSENPNWRILLIEAGDAPSNLTESPATFYAIQGTKEDWQFKTEPGNYCKGLTNERCNWPQGKALGGSSSINAMLAIRGVDQDYNAWSEMGNPGWDWETMQQYFSKVFSKVKTSNYEWPNPIRTMILESAKSLGYESNNPNSWLGYFDFQTTTQNGQRFNAAKAYIASARNRKNLCVLTNAQVGKILFEGNFEETTPDSCPKKSIMKSDCFDRPRAMGVKLTDGRKIYTKKEVVVSSGAINSPKLLMLSGIGPKSHLESLDINVIADLPVGKNLQDHLMYPGFFVELPDLPIQVNFTELVETYCEKREGPVGQLENIILNGFINTKKDSPYPDIQLCHLAIVKDDNFALPLLLDKFGFNQVSSQSLLKHNKDSTFLIILPILLNPISRGRILLKSKNPQTHPLIHAGYMSDDHDEDIDAMVRSIRYLENLIKQEPFGNTKLVNFQNPLCEDLEFQSDAFWKCNLRSFATTLYHFSGTCKMGPVKDPEAVVNSNLKVHGVDGLRVADASIMPKVVSCNTNIPSMAIGEKAADLIKQDYKE